MNDRSEAPAFPTASEPARPPALRAWTTPEVTRVPLSETANAVNTGTDGGTFS
jgi:hypothetical protein